jgi:hypothetical protein
VVLPVVLGVFFLVMFRMALKCVYGGFVGGVMCGF